MKTGGLFLVISSIWLPLATSAHSSGMTVKCHMTKGPPILFFIRTHRTGALQQDRPITAGILNHYDVIERDEVTGYYWAHDQFLVYINDLVDESKAMLDLTYDFKMNRGFATFRQRSHEMIGEGPIICDVQ